MFYGANSDTIRVAAMLRRDMTLAERLLWEKLKDRKIFKTKFRRQHPIFIFIVDFYCHEYKLVVEVDGEIHLNKERHEYDLGRSAVLNGFEITVIRFTNGQVLNSIDFVVDKILDKLKVLTPL